MVDIVKQDMTYLWAISGDVVAPDNAKIQEGWAVEVVPRQWWNWMQYRADSNIAYMLQKGLPEWDATTEYLANKSFVTAGGVVYKCLITNTNLPPLTNPTQWARAFQDYTVASNALGALTPAADRLPYFNGTGTAALTTLTSFARTLLDDTTNTAARTTLGAQASHANLTALSGVTAAINTLPYWTSTTAMAAASLTAYARTLLDDVDATAARATLGLGTAALGTVTTSATDATVGNILRVGDWGLAGGAAAVSAPGNDVDTIVYTGVYAITSTTVNGPSGFGSGSILLHMAWSSTIYHQIAISYSNGTGMAFRRRHLTNGWGAWNYVTNSADLQAALAGIGLNVNAAPNLTDLDLVTVTGFNRFTNSALNRPLSDASGTVMTTFYGTTYATQLAITVQSTDANLYNRTFTRTMNQGTWGPWKESAVVDGGTMNNATFTGTTTVPSGSILKVGTNYTDNTSAALYVNNGFNNGTNGITVDSFAPSISFVDRTTSSGSGRWRQDGNILRFDSSADNGVNWTTNLAGFNQSGTLGVAGVLGQADVGLDSGTQTAGGGFLTGTTQIGVRSHFNGGADATSAVMGFVAENTVGDNTTTATTVSLIDFQSNTQTVNANHTVTTSSSFRANDKTSTRIQTAYGFHSLMATRAGVNRWNVFAAGTAPNYMNGQTIIGGSATLPAANVSLQVNGDQVVSGTLSAATLTATTINATTLNATNFAPTNVNTTGNVTAAGFITAGSYISIKSGVPVNASMYQNCGFQSQTTDGSPPGYGFHRAGSYAVSLYLSAANELEIMDSGGNNRQVVNSQNLPVWMAANSGAGAVGSYALMLLGGGGSGILPGTNIAGANLRYSAASSSNNGTTATGTWRVMGYVVNADFSDSDSVTLCMRIA